MTQKAAHLRPFAGRLWRICAEGADPLAPAAAPEGWFHHDGHYALYASLSAEGAGVALATYATPEDPPRCLWPLDLITSNLADLRESASCEALGIAPGDLVARWAEDRAWGRPARSWRASDRLRALGAVGLIYASRKAPDLAHLVLFAPLPAGCLCVAGPSRHWFATAPIL